MKKPIIEPVNKTDRPRMEDRFSDAQGFLQTDAQRADARATLEKIRAKKKKEQP